MDATVDPRPLLECAVGQFAGLVAAAGPGRLGEPTPCAEFDVRALIGHVLGTTLVYARVAEGATAARGPGGGGDVAGGDWAGAYAAAGKRLVAAGAALDEEGLEEVVDLGFATMPRRGALGAIVMELSAHAWDLREALGAAVRLAPEPAEFALAYARRTLPPQRRGGPVPFGPVRPAPEGADVYGRLAAWLGREAGGRPRGA